MYKVRKARKLADKVFLMDIEAPRVAKHCEPGQFVIVKIGKEGERIPLTICDYDREEGIVTIVFQSVGLSTEKMACLNEGDYFHDVAGPLGCASELLDIDIEKLKNMKILFVGGGVGAAPVYPQANFTSSPTCNLHAPHIPVPSTMIGFILTMVLIPSFFVSRQTNFIIIIGPIATQTS